MESPGVFPDSPMDQDDAVYPCKGCGEILEEGKAFELAGNRWHIDCFRCNTCKTLLDSDANLLLLGDGSLICNNCTYSCSACGNKIEDLAILTGDQAFCANCFKCRNCKCKIENLRYARTSQGIFCMKCHETLMARRRKKSKQNRMNSNGAPAVLDKSLPALPPNALPQQTFSSTPEAETPPEFYAETPLDSSPPPRSSHRKDGSLGPMGKREMSSTELEERKENLTLPASTYESDRGQFVGQTMDESNPFQGGDDGFFIPLALDPNPAPGPSPMNKNSELPEHGRQSVEGPRDHSNKAARKPSSSSHREALRENGPESSRSSSVDRSKRAPPSPHIAYQQKGRQPSSDILDSRARSAHDGSPAQERNLHSQSSSTYTSQAASPAEFKLQDAPKSRKGSVSRKLSKSTKRGGREGASPAVDLKSQDQEYATGTTPEASPVPQNDGRRAEWPARGESSERPARGDSLGHGAQRHAFQRKEVGSSGPTTPTMAGQPFHERADSTTSVPRASHDGSGTTARLNGGTVNPKPTEPSISHTTMEVPSLPARSSSRPSPMPTSAGAFTAPRAAPPAPSERHKTSESIASLQSNSSSRMSPTLPKGGAGDNFTMEEEMSRILKGDQIEDRDSNVLRRVSNAAKHMRSFSDRGGQTPRTQKFARSPSVTNGSVDISSPTTTTSPAAADDGVTLRNRLRRAQQRIGELEAEKRGLEDIVNNSHDMKAINTELDEKRHTISDLEANREFVLRELEVMTENFKKAKDSSRPLDTNALKSEIIRDFSSSLQVLKDELRDQIEELIHKRNELTNEIGDIIQMKDKGLQEYEDLHTRNTQLNKLNNELINHIQRMYENNRSGMPPPSRGGVVNPVGTPLADSRSTTSSAITSPNGLGIYSPQHTKEPSIMSSIDTARANSNDPSLQNLINEDAEPAVMTAPHVVNIRKGRPNMWKKGSQAVAKNFKGIKASFGGANQYPDRGGGYGSQTQTITEGTPYGSMPLAAEPGPTISGPTNVRKGDGMQNFWGGGQKAMVGKGNMRGGQTLGMGMSDGSGSNVANAEDSLFGSELSDRCRFEGREIPTVVTRCIEEVEIRGMDVEGIYRKSGGSGQVKGVQSGFEKDANFDISDPDLDIHAITSTLKQYFRRLPTSLITFDVYDMMLDAAELPSAEKRAQALRASVQALPKAHRDTLLFLNFHLVRVIEHQDSNLMTSLNLAVVFSPTIFRCPDQGRELSDMGRQQKTVQALLDNHHLIVDDDD